MYWFSKPFHKARSFLSFSTSRLFPTLLIALTLFATLSATSTITHAANVLAPITPNRAAKFNGYDAYVTFGNAPELSLSTFTLELWFRWDGGGVTTSTGIDGVEAYPLLAKGRGEGDNSFADLNYFLGINGADKVLVADFAEGLNGSFPGYNHPIFGITPIVENEWYHAAATYDGYQWELFLNGKLETWIIVDEPPRWDSKQHASLATALNATGEPDGFFNGTLDEVRIWDTALSKQALRKHLNVELNDPQPHLVARWSMDDGAGGIVSDSAGRAIHGTAVATRSSLITGAPFNLAPNDVPDLPTLVQPGDTAVDVSTSPTLEVTVTDPEAQPMTVNFNGRPLTASGNDFTIIAMPDTQKYAASSSRYYIFNAQTEWVVDNKSSRNIAHVTQLGDCVDSGGDTSQWDAADTAFSFLEDPVTTGITDGISYSIAVGNKDQDPADNPNGDSTLLYNQYFGKDRFVGRYYYGGHYGTNFDNHYELFSASGMDFILISLEYGGSTSSVLNWADNLLTTYSNRRAIVVTHYMIGTNGSFGGQGQDIYNALKDHPNLFLMHGGHKPGEGRRQDTYNGNTIHTLLADYQSRTNGGDGWMRILEFSPNHNEIRVKTYSPTLDQFETDSNSEFTLDYEMPQSVNLPDFQLIGTVTNVTSGSNASVSWPGLDNATDYEWYVTVNDGASTTTGEYWRFRTEEQGTAPQADFVADVTSGVAPFSVNFTDLSTNAPTSWSWDFGDGGTSSDQNPGYTYNSAGTYTVSLTATNGSGNDTIVKTDYITVSSPAPPVANFSADTLVGFVPLTVNFSDLSTENPTSWDWDFGDGGSSIEQNPGYTYNTPGLYDVALTVDNGIGNDTETKTDYIEVLALPVADLGITKLDQQDPIDASEIISYTIAVTNYGPEIAHNVVVSDTLPASVSYVSGIPGQGSCSETGGIVTCNLNSIALNNSVDITIAVTATAGGVITNHASVSGTVDDQNSSNDTASEDTTVYQTIATQTFSPIHDAHVKIGNSGNFGSDTRLRLRDGDPDYDSYLKFDLSTLAGPVQSATLRLFIDNSGNNGSSIYPVSNDYAGTTTPWEEGGINGNNAPIWSGSPLDTAGPGINNQWLEWDVTNALTTPGTYSFAISTNSSNSVYYHSDENSSNQPELVVNVNVCTPPVEVTDVAASTDGTNVTLSWTGTADQYEIWTGTNEPYFEPGSDCSAASNCELVTPPPSEYIHTLGVGDSANNHAYIIIAVNNCTASSVRSGSSSRMGEFDFSIQPGT